MDAPRDGISTAAILYLALPGAVYCVGWLELIPGVLLCAILASAILPLLRRLPAVCAPSPSLPAFTWLAIIALLWAGLGGAGHFVFANPDWHTRDAVFADLIYSSWPPAYGGDHEAPLILRSAAGFFLVPAAAAKLLGMESARYLLFGWSAVGALLFLCLLPLPDRFGSRLVLLSLVVLGFSGMDYLAILVVHGHAPMFPLPLEWWRPWTYTSLTAQLFWAPNHAIPLWLGTTLIYRHRGTNTLPGLLLVLLPLLLLWTPFAVGLLPWAALALWQRWYTPRCMPTLSQWSGSVLFGGLMLAYLSRPGAEAMPVMLGPTNAGNEGQWGVAETIIAYLQFIAFEFGIMALLLRPAPRYDRQALLIVVSMLILVPLIRIGPSNDWMLRISTPCLVMLLILVLAEVDRPFAGIARTVRQQALLLVLLLGALTPGFEIARALVWKRTPPNYGQSLIEAQRGYLAPNYLGKLDLPILRKIFRTPAPVPAHAGST